MTTIEVVLNACYGGFSLSKIALNTYNEKRTAEGLPTQKWEDDIDRHDPLLVEVVRELGSKANGSSANLIIKKIPAKYATCYVIDEYDGAESVTCSPKNLIAKELCNLNVASLTDNECRETLMNFVKILTHGDH